jgi:bacterioferritin
MYDIKLKSFVQRGLSHEMTAVQHYLTQSSLCKEWGMIDESNVFANEAKEELEHAQRLINFLLSMGMTANATELKSVPATKSLKDILRVDWHIENEVVDLYLNASQYCLKIQNKKGFELFNKLYEEEKHHLNSIENWMSKLN